VLIVEDDATIRTALVRALTARHHSTETAPTAMAGLQSLVAHRPDVVLLDLGLPDLDGAALLAMIRSVSDVPVIVVSARDDGASIVALLDAGADDYLVKPFAMKELLARLRALARRGAEGPRNPILTVADLSLDPARHEVTRSGKKIVLSAREFAILEYLMRNTGLVLTRTMITEHVWDYDVFHQSNAIDVYVRTLRRKMDDGFDPKLIQTVRGIGYRLAVEPGD